MRKIRNKRLLLAAVMTLLISAILTVSAAGGTKPKKILRIGNASRTVTVGSEFELKVRMKPVYAEDDYLRWKIVSGKNVI